ncbi:MAG TPA: hypothetical protein VGR57_21935, partial [Ktedonobacterales bacterium]|nr:hypothetical protein [Ktedonobacterales bacterium]
MADVDTLARDQPVVIALSAFDGVHRGHQALLRRARERAEAAGAALVLATWWPPLTADPAGAAPQLLTTRDERAALLRALAGDATLLESTHAPDAAGILPETL